MEDLDRELLARITVDPQVMVGKPVIRGTRLTVDYILNLLGHGATVPEIIDEYVGLTPEDIRACMLFAARSLADTEFLPAATEPVQVRFLIDECAGPALARWLVRKGHNVFSVFDEARGMRDDQLVQKAHDEHRILVTNDKGFGERIYRDNRPHAGVILLRLNDERAAAKIAALERVLERYPGRIEGRFVVVTESTVRVGRSQADRGP